MERSSHLDQAKLANPLSAMASVCRSELEQDGSYCLRDLCPQEGSYRQGYQVESRRPLRGVYHRFGEPRPELDIDLIPELRVTVIPGDSELRG
jgi:hypothetical protein